jgi:hypothetical protein
VQSVDRKCPESTPGASISLELGVWGVNFMASIDFALFGRGLGLVGCLWLVGCGGAVNESSLPGDGYAIRCEKGMAQCVRRADTLCKEAGYTIVSGRELSKLLGGQTSAYRKLVNEGELQIYCGDRVPKAACSDPQQDVNAVYQLSGANVAEPTPASLAQPSAVSARALVTADKFAQTTGWRLAHVIAAPRHSRFWRRSQNRTPSRCLGL